MNGPRFTLDDDGRVQLAKPAKPTARKYVNRASGAILAACYPGQVPAAVIERALRQMAKRDGLLKPENSMEGQA
ncbi:hypothetical protein [Streptomyces lasiicapitis]|uniref:hypothetical protein n=1 Tax=Streptomyces lasiicapitis TaxID=1923961 RepID=UPI003698E2D3